MQTKGVFELPYFSDQDTHTEKPGTHGIQNHAPFSSDNQYSGMTTPNAYTSNTPYGHYANYAQATGQPLPHRPKRKHAAGIFWKWYFIICGIAINIYFLILLATRFLVYAQKWIT